MTYGPYYESLAAVPNRELSNYLPGRNAAEDAKPIPTKTAKHEGFLWDKKDFSFEDVLDTINPLQHIPLISSMYRESSGDTIGAVPRVVGDALYGGGLIGAAIGAGTALVNVAMEAITGKDVGGTMMALVTGEDGSKDGTAVAERESGTSSAAPTDAALAGKTTTPDAQPAVMGGAAMTHAAKPDNAVAADTAGPFSPAPFTPAQELRTFPGVNLKPAKDTQAKAADTRAAPVKSADHEGAIMPPATPHHAVAPTLPLNKARDDNNAWLGQSIMSGLEKYRTMAREQDKKAATVDGIY